MSSFKPKEILQQMEERDPDRRWMAVSDLNSELEKSDPFKHDLDTERKIVDKLLHMVAYDNARDVQGLAVKCLGSLTRKVSESQVQNILDSLGNYLLNEDMSHEVRDISSIGLKTVISELPEDQTDTVKLIVNNITPRLVNTIASGGSGEDSVEVLKFCLDVLKDLLSRFGSQMGDLYGKVQSATISHLSSGASAVRKRASSCLSQLSIHTNDDIFDNMMKYLISSLEKSTEDEDILTYTSSLSSISRYVGYRFGPYLEKLIPLLLEHSEPKEESEECDIRENCFQTFENLAANCTREFSPFVDKVDEMALKALTFDPNYEESDSEEDEEDMSEEDEFGEMDFSDEFESLDYSDDDDLSWKVRKSAARCIASIIQSYPTLLEKFYANIAPLLVKRFKEREETVKLDIFHAFEALLKATHSQLNGEQSYIKNLESFIPKMRPVFVNQLKQKSDKTKIGIFNIIKQLSTVIPNCFGQDATEFFPGFCSALDESSSSPLKIDALIALRTVIATHKSSVFFDKIHDIINIIKMSLNDSYYKIHAEALKLAELLPNIIKESSNYSLIDDLKDSIIDRLSAQGIDQEVKDVAIKASGALVSILGDHFDVNKCLTLLKDLLGNEVTRLTTVITWQSIARSPLHLDLSHVLNDIYSYCRKFLRKHNRQLKKETLTTLIVIVENYGIQNENVIELGNEIASIVEDSDLHLAHLALQLSTKIIEKSQQSEFIKLIQTKCFELLSSSLLQGLALKSMIDFFDAAIKSNLLVFDETLKSLENITSEHELSKQSYQSIAKVISTICRKDEQTVNNVVDTFIQKTNKGTAVNQRLLAVYVVGEIGLTNDLSFKNVIGNILDGLDDSDESIKSACSVALGHMAVGSLDNVLKIILEEIDNHPNRQYLLVGSIREIIIKESSKHNSQALLPYFDKLTSVLFSHTTAEESTRNIVSECLGKMALIDPNKIYDALLSRVNDSVAETRICVITAVKFSLTDSNEKIDETLTEKVEPFLALLKDEDVSVRKAALQTFNFLAFQKPKILRKYLNDYLPVIYNETIVNPDLIREVDIGPFKHRVDGGFDLRKVSFEIMFTLLDTSFHQVNVQDYITHLEHGLEDSDDIKMLCHLIISRLAKKAGQQLLNNIGPLIEPLRKTILAKPLENPIKQQIEKNEEVIQSALRAIANISVLPESESSPKFMELLNGTVQTSLGEKFETIKSSL